jgi:hypothetical protein
MEMMGNYVLGAAMIPDVKMLRPPNSKVDEHHFVYFSAETIAIARKKFHTNNREDCVNINHDGVQVTGVKLTKSFIINHENIHHLDKEFASLPIGTWMIEYLIENEDIWRKIQDKKLNGFSIEGIFDYESD